MSTTDLLCIMLMAVAAFLWLQSRLRLGMNETLRKQLKAERAPAAAPTVPTGEWRALPGQQIELAATGFYIRMRPDPNQGDFILYSPEGHIVAHGNELPLLKNCGERLAAYRAEFNASPPQLPANLKR